MFLGTTCIDHSKWERVRKLAGIRYVPDVEACALPHKNLSSPIEQLFGRTTHWMNLGILTAEDPIVLRQSVPQKSIHTSPPVPDNFDSNEYTQPTRDRSLDLDTVLWEKQPHQRESMPKFCASRSTCTFSVYLHNRGAADTRMPFRIEF